MLSQTLRMQARGSAQVLRRSTTARMGMRVCSRGIMVRAAAARRKPYAVQSAIRTGMARRELSASPLPPFASIQKGSIFAGGAVGGLILSAMFGSSSSAPPAPAPAKQADPPAEPEQVQEKAAEPEPEPEPEQQAEPQPARTNEGTAIYEVNVDVVPEAAEEFKAWLKEKHAVDMVNLPGFLSAEMLEREDFGAPAPKPSVLFVLGGPGAGKGTQCSKIVENFDYAHISAGDCLRAERKNPDSQHGALINDYIKRGAIVPVEITIALLLKAMEASDKNKFLIDGFPRNANNLQGWAKVVGDKADVDGVLFFDCSEEVMEKRLLKRGEDAGENRRKDDNIESIKKRFKTYVESTRPVITTYDMFNLVHKIDAEKDPEAVFGDVRKVIESISASKATEENVKLTMVYRLNSREDLQTYFDEYAAKLRGDAAAFAGKIKITRRVMKSVAEQSKQ